jgi:hypothetical protein
VGHAGWGLAVLDPALEEVFGAEAFEDVDVRPVCGGRPVVEQSGGGSTSALVHTDMTISALVAAVAT